jgi:hypothetical protein
MVVGIFRDGGVQAAKVNEPSSIHWKFVLSLLWMDLISVEVRFDLCRWLVHEVRASGLLVGR